jgi:hypothetical protein
MATIMLNNANDLHGDTYDTGTSAFVRWTRSLASTEPPVFQVRTASLLLPCARLPKIVSLSVPEKRVPEPLSGHRQEHHRFA